MVRRRVAAYGVPTSSRRPGNDWVVPLDGITDAPLAKIAASMGGAVPPVAPAGQVSMGQGEA